VNAVSHQTDRGVCVWKYNTYRVAGNSFVSVVFVSNSVSAL